MKNIILIFLYCCIMQFGLAQVNNIKKETTIFSQKSYKNYMLYYGINSTQDTIMFIVNKKKLKYCGLETITKINMSNLNQTSSIKVGKKHIFFS